MTRRGPAGRKEWRDWRPSPTRSRSVSWPTLWSRRRIHAKPRDSGPPEKRYKTDCFVDPITLEMIEAPRQTLSRLAEAAIQDLRTNETLIDTAGSAGARAERITEIARFVERTLAMLGETGWFIWPHSSMPSRNLRGQPTEPRISAPGLWRLLAPQELSFSLTGGFKVGYSPRIRPSWSYSTVGIGAVGSLSYLNYAGIGVRIAMGGGLEWTPSQTAGGLSNLFLPQNLQARATATLKGPGDWFMSGGSLRSVGLEISGHFLYSKLRVAYHHPGLFRDGPGDLSDIGVITIGFNDLTGVGYWGRAVLSVNLPDLALPST